jgi:hypothetical protein
MVVVVMVMVVIMIVVVVMIVTVSLSAIPIISGPALATVLFPPLVLGRSHRITSESSCPVCVLNS